MNHVQRLLIEHLDLWSAVGAENSSGRGRASTDTNHIYGVAKLREVILGLAVSGRLISRSESYSATKLLDQIYSEREALISAGLIKKSKPLKLISDIDIPFTIPRNWIWVRLGEITNFGVTEKQDSIEDDVWVLDLEDIEKDTSKLLRKCRYSDRKSLSDKNLFKAGDVLYGKLRPYLNKVLVADEDGVCTTEILPIRCYGPYVSEYFKHALMSPYFLKYTASISYGMKMPRLGTEGGRDALFPLPPVEEQRQIADKVNELMLLCDRLEASITKANALQRKIADILVDQALA